MAQTGKGSGTAASSVGYSLTSLKSICYYHGWNDRTTEGEAALTRFINRTLCLLSVLAPWPEYHKRDGCIELNQYTGDITAFADAGSSKTTVTSASHGLSNGFYVTISGTTSYNGSFFISSVATNTFVISTAYVADDATGSFVCGQDAYICTDDSDATITDISKVGSVMRTDRMTPIDLMTGGIDEWMEKSKLKPRSGSPTEYTFRKYVDGSGQLLMEMLVYPKPGSGQVGDYLYYPYWLLPTQLVNASDATDWPNYRLWLLEEALEHRLASGKRDNMGVALEAPEFMMHVRKAMADSRTSYMPMPITKQVDIRRRSIREAPIQVTE